MTGLGGQAVDRLRALADRLDAVGADWSRVSCVREYVVADHLDEYTDVVAARLATLGDVSPPIVTTVVETLFDADASVRIEIELAGTAGEPAAAPDGSISLPTILPVDEHGDIVAPGDFRGQYRWCLERAAALLTSMGLGPQHLVQTIDFSTSATRDVYSMCGRPRREILGPVFPGAAGILVSALPHPDVLVGFELTASSYLPEAVNPGWERYATLTYNPAVLAGRVLYGSGFAALDPVTQLALHDGDPGAQTTFTYESILAVLAAGGAGPEHLTRIAEYVTPAGVPDVSAIAAAREKVLGRGSVTPVTVGCATLLRPEFLLEVVPTAVLPG